MPPPATRSAWSCENCRRRKVRCNSQDPCSHCKRRGEQCQFPGNANYASRPAQSPPSDTQLQARIERIEAILTEAGLSETLIGLSPGDGRRQEQRVEAILSGAGLSETLIGASPDGSRSQEHRVQEQRPVEIAELAAASRGGFAQEDARVHDGFDHHIIGTSPAQLRNDHETEGTLRTSIDAPIDRNFVLRLLARVVPAKQQCDELVHSYLYNVEWIHHPLNVLEFRSQYEAFWQQYKDSSNSLPGLQWLALLMIILCLGSHFHQQRQSLAAEEQMYAASSELLTLSGHLANHSVTVIQTLILMGLWLNDRGLSNTHHAQLALAIKMATNLGLSKLDAADNTGGNFANDDEQFFSLDKVGSPYGKSAERELRRRLWWSLVCQDYYTASSCNFTYSIHPKQSKTLLFLNVDEQELRAGDSGTQIVAGYPLETVATMSSYHLLKIPFARIAKAVVDLYNDEELTYTAVLDLEKLLWDIYDEMPEYFKWQATSGSMLPIPTSTYAVREHLEWQRLFLVIGLHNRVLRLHRPFLAHGYIDDSMAHSRRAAIDSALVCIDLAEHGRSINFPGLRWWVILIHIFTAAVALCVDHHFLLQSKGRTHKTDSRSTFRKLVHLRQQQITRAIDLLSPASGSSIAAARAISVIEGLLTQAKRHSGEKTMPNGTDTGQERSQNRNITATAAFPNSLEGPASVATPNTTGATTSPESSFYNPEYNEWSAGPSLDDWTGPDWDQLFTFLSDDSSTFNEGINSELFEAMNPFATGFKIT